MALSGVRPVKTSPSAGGEVVLPVAMPSSAASATLSPMDWLTVGYLGMTLVLLAACSDRSPRALPLAFVHALGIAAIFILRTTPLRRYPITRIVLGFYPLPLFAFCYSEIAVLDRLLHPTAFFDGSIQEFEAWMFRSQPSQALHRWLPFPWLGEYLHLGYLSYYTLVPTLVTVLWFRRSRQAFERSIATIGLAFYLSFICFMTVPVMGPFHAFGPFDPGSLGVFLPRVTRWILDRGSALGSAFPSSHVAVSVTTWIMAMRYHRGIALLYLFMVPALALGAIYGGYHYATDVAAGGVLAVLTGTLGHRLVVALESRSSGGRS